jgi:hypothetical protein
MLDSHPDIAFRYESEFFVELLSDGDDGAWPELDAYDAFLARQRWVSGARPVVDRSLDYPALVRSFLEQHRDRAGKRFVGATVHKHFDRLLRIWPDARFIHLLRDPRDVAQSCVAQGWYGNVWHACDRWLDAERCWDRVCERVPLDRRIEVHYEDLVSRPVFELTRIGEFIGPGFDPEMLSYPARSSYGPPQSSLANQWPRRLTPLEVQLIEARTAFLLEDRGYRLSAHPRLTPNAITRAVLTLHNRVGENAARLRSLGPRLWLEHAIAKRVGPPAWSEAVERRVHEVQNERLD